MSAGVRIAAAVARRARDRHAPRTLARNAPVRPRDEHAGHPLRPHSGIHRTALASDTAAARNPSMLMNHCGVARRSPADDNASRYGYECSTLAVNQSRPALLERRDDDRVGLEDFEAADDADVVVEAAVVPDRRVDVGP